MSLFRSSDAKAQARKTRKAPKTHTGNRAHPAVEALEDRSLPSGNTISGHVFYDLNNNGLVDGGEKLLGNVTVELRNAQNTLIGTATTDANGFYQFDHDATVDQSVHTITKTLNFPATQTNFSLSGVVGQFDPSLGTLVGVDITNAGSITSDIRVENTSTSSASSINATISGNLTLMGPGGLTVQTNLSQNAGTFNASIYDSNLDFSGTSGKDFGNKTANGTQSVTLTGNDMAPFIGTGNVTLTEAAVATSTASGGGNVLVGVTSTATAQITVVYRYIASNNLKPGAYTLVKPGDPATYIDGKESRNGQVLNNPPNNSVIPLTLVASDLPNNDFAEIKTSSLAGYVYSDTSVGGSNDGVKQPGEAGIPSVTIKLDGNDDTGPVHRTTTTDANGFYQFGNLRPGSYALTETQPAGVVDGKDTIGTPGGITTNDQFTSINLPSSFDGANNNFGEVKPSSLSGYVYADMGANGFNDGTKQASEAGIGSVTVNLDGTDSNGAVHRTTTTDANGFYQFNNLQAGTYSITEAQPTGYLDGKDTVGTPGGSTGNDQFAAIILPASFDGTNNNFGEIRLAQISGTVFNDTGSGGVGVNNALQNPGEPGIAGVNIKLSGVDYANNSVNQVATTDAAGQYTFNNLAPGTYTVTETQPANYLDGKDALGSLGGQQSNDQFSAIVLPAGGSGANYNFGELLPSTIAGFVYGDTSVGGFNNGNKEASEQGIAGTLITLVGTTDQGAVMLQQTTDANGMYMFTGLRAGTYTITEAQPAGWLDGKDSLGWAGGVIGNDVLSNINLPVAAYDPNNNFGELKVAPVILVSHDPILPTDIVPAPPQITTPTLAIISKGQLLASKLNTTDATITAEARYVNGLYTSILGRPVEDGGLNGWLGYLHSGGTRRGLADAIWKSDEHRAREINSMYQSILGTGADQNAVNVYTAMFRNGASEFNVAAAIAGSPQALALFPNPADLINKVYDYALGRSPAQSELTAWLSFPGDRTSLAFSIITSDEALGAVVQRSFLQLLGRAASPAEVAGRIGQLRSSPAGFNAMISDIFTSNEFATRWGV